MNALLHESPDSSKTKPQMLSLAEAMRRTPSRCPRPPLSSNVLASEQILARPAVMQDHPRVEIHDISVTGMPEEYIFT